MLNITSIGTVVQTSTHHGVMFGKPVIYPDGYTVERAVFSSSQLPVAQAGKPMLTYKALSTTSAVPPDEPYFTAAIHWVKGQPNFTITRSDNPAEKIYTDSKSATTAWRKALQDAMKDFPSRQAELPVPMDSKSKLQVNGIRMYGLHLKDVHDELLALPGGQAAFDAAAAAAASAGPAISTEAAGAAELDAHSTSLLSPPGSQPQAKTQRLHTISPTPKSSANSSAKAHSSAGSSKRRTTPTRRASVDKDGSPATSTVDVGTTVIIRGSSLTDGAAIIPEKRQRTHRSKGPNKAAATPEPTAAITEETAEITAVVPAKRRRTSSKKPSETARALAAVPTPVHATVVCPDCGLGDTPFCSTTGKPHMPPPCTVCGLTTAFCPVTGQPHTGAVHRENRQRGEVHLPGAARKPRRLLSKHLTGVHAAAGSGVTTMAVAGAEDDGSAVDAVKAAGAAKKLRQKRLRNDGEAKRASGDAADAFAMDTTEKPARARRARKTKDGAAAAAPSSESVVEGTTVMRDGTAVASPAAVVVKSPPAPVEEPAYTYPPLRPPLTPREHHKAAHLLQENWKVQYGDGSVLPAAVAAVPLAFVPAKRMATAGANRRGRGHGGASGSGASGEDGKQSDDDEDGGEEEIESARAKDRDDDGGDVGINRSNTKRSLGSAVGGSTPTTAAAVASPKMVHPLEVTQLATSVAGKRLSRFLLQYTSERTFFDLLKNSSSAVDGSAGRKTSKQPAQQTPAGTDAGAGDEGDAEAHTVSDDGDGKHVLDASGAAPTEGRKGLVIHNADAAEGVVLQERCGAVRCADPPTATTSS